MKAVEERKTILVVDDEQKILDVVRAYLENGDYKVITALDGENALNIFENEIVHLIILDLMLPKISGIEVCNKIRARSTVPIIMLTARSEEEDKIKGISIGADDYLTKPFSVRELVVRVGALIRRSYRNSEPLADILVFNGGNLKVDIKKIQVIKNGKILNMTTYEFKILKALLTSPGQVFSREELVEKAFGIDYDGVDRTIDTYIKNIRQKIEDNPKEPRYIITIYRMGYKFVE